jgi:hypothetical protein
LNASIELIRECLSYDPETGKFTWRARPRGHFKAKRHWSIWNVRYAGKPAGSLTSQGYITISINRKAYKAHRLAIAITTGEFPTKDVDHKNMDRADNSIKNLREATKAENGANRADVYAGSGVKGVSWNKREQAFRVRVSAKFVGRRKTLEEARELYFQKASEKFGEFARSVWAANLPAPCVVIITEHQEAMAS